VLAHSWSDMTFPARIFKKLVDPVIAPLLIGFGLVILIVCCHWPAPILAALGLIVLGTTLVTIDRFSTSPALPFILALHSLTYASLLALFIGALLHSANSFTPFHALDITASGVLIVIAVERILMALRTHSGLIG
jgi:hypothetical protein